MLVGKHILLGVSSSVACYKAVELARLFQKSGAEVRVIMTKNAANLVQPLQFEAVTGNPVYCDIFNCRAPWEVEHVAMAKWGDVFVVAPATANILAKMAAGIADDAPTTLYLAFPHTTFVAPAMHTEMWLHPATQDNIAILQKRGVRFVGPETGELASGDVGIGRMAEPEHILEAVMDFFAQELSLKGRCVLVTAGPTQEAIDPVRFISNRSSGKMGYAIAEEAARRGAEVTLVSGPTLLPDPPGVTTIRIRTALEMHREALARAEKPDIFIFAAAVSDYRPEKPSEKKMKKTPEKMTLGLAPNPDIARDIGRRARPDQVLVGFSAETHNIEQSARKKMKEKHFDLIVANDVSSEGIGMGAELNAVVLLSPGGKPEKMGPAPKKFLAGRILDKVAEVMNKKKM